MEWEGEVNEQTNERLKTCKRKKERKSEVIMGLGFTILFEIQQPAFIALAGTVAPLIPSCTSGTCSVYHGNSSASTNLSPNCQLCFAGLPLSLAWLNRSSSLFHRTLKHHINNPKLAAPKKIGQKAHSCKSSFDFKNQMGGRTQIGRGVLMDISTIREVCIQSLIDLSVVFALGCSNVVCVANLYGQAQRPQT
jgi:hypothetical protein